MPTFLQPVAIPERCYLFEVLLWVTFLRLPIAAIGDDDGNDIRESDEIREEGGGYAINVIDEYIFDEECERAGLPPDPNWRAAIEGTTTLSVKYYDDLLKQPKLTKAFRRKLRADREEALRFEADVKRWKSQYERVIEYPVSKIFVALKDGLLPAAGRLLPSVDLEQALVQLSEDGLDIVDVEPSPIPPSFWTLRGIDFHASAARSENANFCHITCATADMFSVFPGDREEILGVERVGGSFIVSETASKPLATGLRGRPPYPWDAFHLEVSSLLLEKSLPEKKEAAIQLLQDWFQRRFRIQPSRAAIGEKLTPYYETFIRKERQKIR
jgi:hypothetical protein